MAYERLEHWITAMRDALIITIVVISAFAITALVVVGAIAENQRITTFTTGVPQ